ncbi:hypothetical protein Harman_24140 [Haloarcula mannanilytica]|uniref:Uncharacterized protein n=1 Tax=Haloarcula mannanilytica TaxID=2509225 RepID=A0A4C2EQN0_9EURY|nr:hypothetical protein Harman_24140 [Haloarcula mannanilytica]
MNRVVNSLNYLSTSSRVYVPIGERIHVYSQPVDDRMELHEKLTNLIGQCGIHGTIMYCLKST